MSWRGVDVEGLIGEDHPARAIWTLVGGLDLRQFYQVIESSAEPGGRPACNPQFLISLWNYTKGQGIGSAREVARRCEYDPAFQWLTGLPEVNYHKPAEDRVAERLGKRPQQMVADGGYPTRENIEQLAGRAIDFLGSWRWENVPSGATTPNRVPPSGLV